jgi:Antibiotic biosynthesis monooxygenase
MGAVHLIVWEFTVAADRVIEFEAAYGPDGPWAHLFRRDPGFIGVDLVVGDEPGTYVTIDHWIDRRARERFSARWRQEYDELDARLAGLTIAERLVARGDVTGGLHGDRLPG